MCAVVLTVVVGIITVRAATTATAYRSQQECASRVQADQLGALADVVLADTPEARTAAAGRLDTARQQDPALCFP